MATIQLIRNATLKITYNKTTFLVDPMLGKKHSFESYGEVSKNPIVDLPLSTKNILDSVDAVLVSHLHKDHFDDAAKQEIEKSIPFFCQPNNLEAIKEAGFFNVTGVEDFIKIENTKIYRTSGKHGRGSIEKLMGKVSGFILKNENEPTIYIIGDCVFNQKVKDAINKYKPDIIITNSGGAYIPGFENDLILMDENETIALANFAKSSKIIAVHLESLDHCTTNRAKLKLAQLKATISSKRFFIPLDGETISFN